MFLSKASHPHSTTKISMAGKILIHKLLTSNAQQLSTRKGTRAMLSLLMINWPSKRSNIWPWAVGTSLRKPELFLWGCGHAYRKLLLLSLKLDFMYLRYKVETYCVCSLMDRSRNASMCASIYCSSFAQAVWKIWKTTSIPLDRWVGS